VSGPASRDHYSYTLYADPEVARRFDDRRFGGPIGELIASTQARVLANFVGRIQGRPILDVGTGTGCVAITLALESHEAAELAITGTDISDGALAVARDNAVRLGATGVVFRLGSLLAELPGPIDLIVSNPPYVPVRDRDMLQRDVVRFEPSGALFGGDDGLDVIRRLIPAARHVLAPTSALMLEIGLGQADRVTALRPGRCLDPPARFTVTMLCLLR